MQETLRLPPDLQSPARARQWLTDLCAFWSCEELAFDAALLVSELTTNALLHTDGGTLVVTASFEQSLLTVVVNDDHGEPLPAGPSPTTESGRGLPIVQAYAHDWDVRHDETGKSVWFTLLASPRPER
jgi:anti-sigma regulatory factor (Ser/Thr protein kinase)